MDPIDLFALHQSRRQFFSGAGIRLGGLALAMLAEDRLFAAEAAAPRPFPALAGMPHFPPKAKALIYLHMNGGPAQMDLWDYKPGLSGHFDQDLPDSVRMGQRLSTMTSGQVRFPVAPSKYQFAQHGKSGTWISELLPHTAKIADDLCVVRSCTLRPSITTRQ